MIRLKSVFAVIFVLYMVLQPVVPYIEYYAFKQYIITNLCVEREVENSCCKGKCYLEKKVSEANETEDNNTKAPTTKKTEISPYVLPTKINLQKDYFQETNSTGYINNMYSFLIKKTIFHPPKNNSQFV